MSNKKNCLLIYIIITWLICIDFLGLIPNLFTFQIRGIWCIAGLIFTIPYINSIPKNNLNFKNEILCFLLIPFISGLSATIHYDQTLIQNTYLWFSSLIWTIYFSLHIHKISTRYIEIFMLLMSLIILFLQISGQFLGYKIGGYINTDEIEIRNGLLRLRYDTTMAMFCLFLFWCKFLRNTNLKDLLLSALMLLSIYLSLTRLRIFGAIVPLIYSILNLKNKGINIKLFITFGVTLILVFYFSDNLFGFFIDKTTSDAANDTNIRDYSIIYFWKDTTDDWLKIIIGNGIPHQDSLLGKHLIKINSMGYYADDVGVIGQWWYFGIIYIITWISVLYKILWKFRKVLPQYIKLYFLGTTAISFYFYPLAHEKGWLIWVLILYIADKEIQKYKIEKKCRTNQLQLQKL